MHLLIKSLICVPHLELVAPCRRRSGADLGERSKALRTHVQLLACLDAHFLR